MNKKGFITLIGIIVLLVISILIFNLLENINKNTYLIKARKSKIASKDESRNKLNLALVDDNVFKNDFLPNLTNLIKNNKYLGSHIIKLDRDDLLDGDQDNKLEYKIDNLYKPYGMKPFQFKIKASSNLNGIKTSLISSVSYINPLFLRYKGEDQANEYFEIEYDHVEKLEKLFKTVENDSEDGFYRNNDFFRLENTHTRYNSIEKYNDGLVIDNSYKYPIDKDEIALFMKASNSSLYIVNKSETRKAINLSGIIYINGDLIIKDNFKFDGIIIINNGSLILDRGIVFDCNGLILSREKIDMFFRYDENLVYKYGVYLPGFIELNILDIKEE